ncbi:MAG: hypothetical protein FIB08_12080 [Candidatus Methanoperedens sp.]|nr:hypothetical protein [Candidatus Methanoperedens sp.]
MTYEDDFKKNLTELKMGAELTTYTNKKSEISKITTKEIVIYIQKSKKKRNIEIADIEKAYINLREGNNIESIKESIESIIGDKKWIYSYVWAILSNFKDIETKGKQLSYKY